jgi:hypothetical protein
VLLTWEAQAAACGIAERRPRRSAAHLLTRDEARRIAKLPELLSNHRPLSTHFRYNLNFGHFAAVRSLTSWANKRHQSRGSNGSG